jgi:protein-tyrosine phosphatase
MTVPYFLDQGRGGMCSRPLLASTPLTRPELRKKFHELEWQQRERHGRAPIDPEGRYARLQGDEVARRNRYFNVDPYAHNRVRLLVPAGESDYINASPVTLHGTDGAEKRYIATQGPKDNTYAHFWQMVSDLPEPTVVIVMLTQTHEGGREKCYQYFPADPSQSPMDISADPSLVEPTTSPTYPSVLVAAAPLRAQQPGAAAAAAEQQTTGSDSGFRGRLVLQTTVEDAASRTTVREMTLVRDRAGGGGAQTKRVLHLQFCAWPDFLVPEGADRDALVRLVRLTRSLSAAPTVRDLTALSRAQQHRRPATPLRLPATIPGGGNTFTLSPAPAPPAPPPTPAVRAAPVVAHCSAGVGRTGSFVAVDWALAEVEAGAWDAPVDGPGTRGYATALGVSGGAAAVAAGARRAVPDPLLEAVAEMRRQRMMMVQNEEQFAFLYEVARDSFLVRRDELMRR